MQTRVGCVQVLVCRRGALRVHFENGIQRARLGDKRGPRCQFWRLALPMKSIASIDRNARTYIERLDTRRVQDVPLRVTSYCDVFILGGCDAELTFHRHGTELALP